MCIYNLNKRCKGGMLIPPIVEPMSSFFDLCHRGLQKTKNKQETKTKTLQMVLSNYV